MMAQTASATMIGSMPRRGPGGFARGLPAGAASATSARARAAAAWLRDWAETVRASDLPHLHAFTRGLDLDTQAVIAAVTLTFHNGRTEGVNTKTKMIKRQMYGRAGFTLLRHRIRPG